MDHQTILELKTIILVLKLELMLFDLFSIDYLYINKMICTAGTEQSFDGSSSRLIHDDISGTSVELKMFV